MRVVKKNPARNIDRNSREFQRRKDRADEKIYKAVQVTTAVLTIGVIAGFGVASNCVNKKADNMAAKTVLCEDKMESSRNPECVDAKTNGKQDKSKPVSNPSD